MTVAALIHVLASAPLFASRAFLTAFLSALIFRFGPSIPILQDAELIASLAAAPPWFTHDYALGALGLLAAFEAWAERSPEVRDAFREFEGLIKGAVALAITFGLLDSQSAAVVAPVLGVAAGTGPAMIGAATAGMGSLALATARRAVLRPLEDFDVDDTLGARSVVTLAEEGSIVGGFALLILAPAVALVAILTAVIALSGLRAWFATKEEQAKVDCGACEARHHASALVCPSCGVAASAPRAVGAFGQAKADPAPAPAVHAHALLQRRRCSRCATRLRGSSMTARCPACETPAFADASAVSAYVQGLHGRLGVTLAILGGMSFIPVLGMIPGLILVRLSVIAPLRAYTPAVAGLAARWGNRVATVLLLCLQPIPILGAAMLPLIGWTSWSFHRAALEGAAD